MVTTIGKIALLIAGDVMTAKRRFPDYYTHWIYVVKSQILKQIFTVKACLN